MRIFFVAVLMLGLSGPASADPAQLMNEVISSYNQISGKSQKARLSVFESIVLKIEERNFLI